MDSNVEEKTKKMLSEKSVIIGGVVAAGIAAAAVVAVGIGAYYLGKKNCDPVDCPSVVARKYNFYPGLDAFSGVASMRSNTLVIPDAEKTCDMMSGGNCAGFNSGGWFSKSVSPVSSWWASRARFAKGYGSYIAETADPFSAINSPDSPWVYFPGCSLNSVQDEVDTLTGTVDELKAAALAAGHIAFSDDGKMYDALPVKTIWIVGQEQSLYVLRDHMPADA
jgi:hypothetical protein